MPSPVLPLRFEEDLTGVNPANFITNHPHDLDPSWRNRILVPPYGAFYTAGLVLRDESGARLNRGAGKHYLCIESPRVHASPGNFTLNEVTGKETAQFIVIIDPSVSNRVYSDIHYVGGAYSFGLDAVLGAISALDLDNRPVSWEDVADRDRAFLPAFHMTDARDIMNLGTVCYWLEKIHEAIMLGDTDRWRGLYAYLRRYYPSTVDIGNIEEDLYNPGYHAFLMANA